MSSYFYAMQSSISLLNRREATVYLHCDRTMRSGEERLTTIGDSQLRLSYVSVASSDDGTHLLNLLSSRILY